MPSRDTRLLRQRLRNQCLSDSPLCRPEEIVAWFGAVQAQDLPGALWAIGQRSRLLSESSVQQAVDDGRILRTHVLRPTWHFVMPADIRWMLELTGERVKAACASYHRFAGLDARFLAKSQRVIARALEGGHRTRPELRESLARAGMEVSSQTMGHLLVQAELDAVICSGAKRGTQFTYALFEERVPHVGTQSREAGLAELARRYFQSHGPATLADFGWWSGLTIRDAKAGIALVAPSLVRQSIDGHAYWHTENAEPASRRREAHLLPNFDEYTVAYRDRQLVVDGATPMTNMEVLAPVIVIDGRVAGTWKRSARPGAVSIAVRTRRALTRSERSLLARAADDYGRFLGAHVVVAESRA